MLWCLLSVLVGAAVFASGIYFERWKNEGKNAPCESASVQMNESGLLRQWENLLEYDGTKQEVEEYEDR